jgi:hypothetical protein
MLGDVSCSSFAAKPCKLHLFSAAHNRVVQLFVKNPLLMHCCCCCCPPILCCVCRLPGPC